MKRRRIRRTKDKKQLGSPRVSRLHLYPASFYSSVHSHELTGSNGEPNPWILSVMITYNRAGHAQTPIPTAQL